MDVLAIAKVAHEANRAYCQTQGDTSQREWEDAPDWQRVSSIEGVERKLFHPETTPEQSHEGWLARKVQEGWQYGPVKDPALKLHPCMVPYASLPFAQRIKDTLFTAVVAALALAWDGTEAPRSAG